MNPQVLTLIEKIAAEFGYEPAAIKAFCEVETGGKGFDLTTGKIMIQFEPAWFKKKAPYAPSGLWSLNKVERQRAEWIAFNDAFRKNPEAAMESTSIGLGQIMGFHWKRLGYDSVGEMWDDAKKGLDRQIYQICQFIRTDEELERALRFLLWPQVARIYNGPGYMDIARKYGRIPYDVDMKRWYNYYNKTV